MCTKLLVALAVLSGVIVAVGPTSAAQEIFPYTIHEKTLGNGLRVVVIPYDSAGTISFTTLVRTGSRDEVEPGRSGFAHLLEHMMSRSAGRSSTEQQDDRLQRMGAASEADTCDDRTRYSITGPAAELETIMDMESDRFKNLTYSEEDFERDTLAVLREYNKEISSPLLPMWERLRQLAFRQHPYSHTTTGYREDIESMSEYYAYSLEFFDRFYRPENSFLLVIGDADPNGVYRLAERYWGDWKPGYRESIVVEEPPQNEPREGHIDWHAPTRPYLMAGYRIPAFSAETVDAAALAIIEQLLFGESAPLYQMLMVEEQWVDALRTINYHHRDPFLFTFYTRIKSNDLVPKVRAAIGEHLEQLKEELVDEGYLARVKSHLRYSFALGLESPAALRDVIGTHLWVSGDPNDVNRIHAQYQRVTPQDIQRVARQVFRASRSTTVTLSHTASQEVATGSSTATES